jgi:hypothetical protein
MTMPNIRAGKFVHDALREGIRLRPKTWGKKSWCPRADRRKSKSSLRKEIYA